MTALPEHNISVIYSFYHSANPVHQTFAESEIVSQLADANLVFDMFAITIFISMILNVLNIIKKVWL